LVAAAVAHGLHSAPPAAAAVTPSFSFAPASPLTFEQVNFTSNSTTDQPPLTELWDLDDDGKFDDAGGPTASRSFSHPGDRRVSLQVTDVTGVTGVVSQLVPVGNRPPTASFGYSPASPQTNETVTFKSTSKDPDGSVRGHAWDLDNDGQFDDGTGSTAQRSFKGAGSYTVLLRVTDDKGATSIASDSVAVGNRAPTVSFAYVPATPLSGQMVSFLSTASDPDGPLAQQAWDLDNDGQFDDATGPAAARSFGSPGGYIVGLRVTDDQGVSVAGFETIVVQPASSVTALGLRLMTPFPIVRISGTITSHGAKLRRLSVSAPRGASIVVRCRGRSCPRHRYSRTAAAGHRARAAALLRIRRFERFLRTGTRLEIFIRKDTLIGKYTRFRIRSGKAPARLDRCLAPGVKRYIRCPVF
jgi:PKD repeat protein